MLNRIQYQDVSLQQAPSANPYHPSIDLCFGSLSDICTFSLGFSSPSRKGSNILRSAKCAACTLTVKVGCYCLMKPWTVFVKMAKWSSISADRNLVMIC
jgi:hypothetical protein